MDIFNVSGSRREKELERKRKIQGFAIIIII